MNTPQSTMPTTPLVDAQAASTLAQQMEQQLHLGTHTREELFAQLQSMTREHNEPNELIPISPQRKIVISEVSRRYYEITLHALIDRECMISSTLIPSSQTSPRLRTLIDTMHVQGYPLEFMRGDIWRTGRRKGERFGMMLDFTTFDYNNPQEILYVKREPHIIVSQKVNNGTAKWREDNTIYERQKTILFGLRPIDKETYEKGVHLK